MIDVTILPVEEPATNDDPEIAHLERIDLEADVEQVVSQALRDHDQIPGGATVSAEYVPDPNADPVAGEGATDDAEQERDQA